MSDVRRISDHYIIVKELVPPMGHQNFYAKVKIGFGDESIPHQTLGFETYGETRQEAQQKAEVAYQTWLKKELESQNHCDSK